METLPQKWKDDGSWLDVRREAFGNTFTSLSRSHDLRASCFRASAASHVGGVTPRLSILVQICKANAVVVRQSRPGV